MTEDIDKQDFVTFIRPAPEHDRPSYMRAFDWLVSGPVDHVTIKQLSDDLFWVSLEKGDSVQRIVISSASGRAKVVGRTEID